MSPMLLIYKPHGITVNKDGSTVPYSRSAFGPGFDLKKAVVEFESEHACQPIFYRWTATNGRPVFELWVEL